jgi:hypothetical protein
MNNTGMDLIVNRKEYVLNRDFGSISQKRTITGVRTHDSSDGILVKSIENDSAIISTIFRKVSVAPMIEILLAISVAEMTFSW